MSKSKKIKSFFLAATALLLTGCTTIAANPSFYDDKLVNVGDNEVYNNIESTVIDLLKDQSTTKSDVRDAVLAKLAESYFGKWEDVDKESDFAKDVNRRVAKLLLDDIKGGSYSYRSKFDEEKFALSIVKKFYKVNGSYDLSLTSAWHKDIIFTPDVTEDNVGTVALHLDYYSDYINDVLVPKVYQSKLVEKYLIENEYRSLYLSHARKVHYVAITINDNHPEAARYLIDEFIDSNIINGTAETANLEILANAWRGVDSQFVSNESALLNAAELVGAGFDNTIYGDLLSDYNKITADVKTTDSSIESTFTSNGSYTKEVGLDIKTTDTKVLDYTTDGWYVRDGGLSSLPTAIRDRLFSRSVESGVDYVLDDEGNSENGGHLSDDETEINSYVRNIHGKYYLMPESVDRKDSRNFLNFDASSKTYYIIQVDEAVNRAKFTVGDDSVYQNLDEIVGEVAKVLATKDTNKTLALSKYIEDMDIKFHDQDIYDYFQEQYPDIFDN
ncbi:MAG: hypothetical protein WCQ71_00165 [Bacilli bacterium]